MAKTPTGITIRRSLEDWKLFCERVQNSNAVNLSEPKIVQDDRKKRALKDYNYFVKTYFSLFADADCAKFQISAANAILKDENIIAVLEWAREHAKSVHATVFIPMWLLANDQLTGMILMGQNQDAADNLLSDIQAQLQFNELFIHDFGDQYNFGSWEEGDFTTQGGIRFLSIGRDKSPRGARKNEKRPNYAVVDDIDDDELVHNGKRVRKIVERIMGALYFALSIKGARLVVAGNRIHANSVLANIVGDTKPGAPKREGIYHSKVCAIENGLPAWPERYSLEELNRKIKKGGILARKEFFHENHVEGVIFKDSMIHFRAVPKLKEFIVIIGYFDPSFENNPKSDFKAVRVWGLRMLNGDPMRSCLKSFVQRAELIKAFEFMSHFEDKLPPGVGVIWYVESQFFNRPVREALQAHNKKRMKEGKKTLSIICDERNKENKYTRIVKMEPAYSNGECEFDVQEVHNPDMIEGNNQLKGIEPGYNSPDDSPDADEGCWYYLDQHIPQRNFQPIIGQFKQKTFY